HQLQRLAQRAVLGIARAGGGGEHTSGDLMLAFSSANAGRLTSYKMAVPPDPFAVDMLPDGAMTDLFWGAIQAGEEAILDGLVAARGLWGGDGTPGRAPAQGGRVAVMPRSGRGPSS